MSKQIGKAESCHTTLKLIFRCFLRLQPLLLQTWPTTTSGLLLATPSPNPSPRCWWEAGTPAQRYGTWPDPFWISCILNSFTAQFTLNIVFYLLCAVLSSIYTQIGIVGWFQTVKWPFYVISYLDMMKLGEVIDADSAAPANTCRSNERPRFVPRWYIIIARLFTFRSKVWPGPSSLQCWDGSN